MRDVLDPEIRLFQQRMAEGFAAHPDLASVSRDERRRIAELVRAPWRAGGPVMHSTAEHRTRDGGVRLRVYRPTAAASAPALIYVHGGGWVMFSLDTHDRLMREYAARAGVVVVGVDYSLSPEAKYPTALNEVVEAVRWVFDQGAAVGIQPLRLALGGDSAGANLAVAAALTLRDTASAHLLSALLLNYGVYDCASAHPIDAPFGGDGFMLTPQEMTGFVESYLASGQDARAPLVSPLHADLAGLPPAFMAVAECDILCGENVAMADRLRGSGGEIELRIYPGTAHSFLEAVSVARVSDRALHEAAVWLRARLISG